MPPRRPLAGFPDRAPTGLPARFTHSGPAPTERNDAKTLKTLLPYLLEFKGRVALALSLLMLACWPMSACRGFKDIVDQLSATQAALAIPRRWAWWRRMAWRGWPPACLASCATRCSPRSPARHPPHCLASVRAPALAELALSSGAPDRRHEPRYRARHQGGHWLFAHFTLFNILPTLVEIGLVAGILLVNYHWSFAVVTF